MRLQTIDKMILLLGVVVVALIATHYVGTLAIEMAQGVATQLEQIK